MKPTRPAILAFGISLFVFAGCSGGAFTTVETEQEVPGGEQDASLDGATSSDGAAGGDGGGGAEAGTDAAIDGGADAGDAQDPDAGDGDTDDADIEDGAVEDADGGPEPPADASDASDGGQEDGCTPLTWYFDGDGDGWGGDVDFQGCEPPEAGVWVTKGGDCHDGNADVHPEQARFFTVAYTKPGIIAEESFDYDCDGQEKNEAKATSSEAGCKAVSIGNCSGSGYLPVNPVRPGASVNPFCGSTTRRTCTAVLGGLLGCEAPKLDTSSPPLGCR